MILLGKRLTFVCTWRCLTIPDMSLYLALLCFGWFIRKSAVQGRWQHMGTHRRNPAELWGLGRQSACLVCLDILHGVWKILSWTCEVWSCHWSGYTRGWCRVEKHWFNQAEADCRQPDIESSPLNLLNAGDAFLWKVCWSRCGGWALQCLPTSFPFLWYTGDWLHFRGEWWGDVVIISISGTCSLSGST